MRVAYADPPYYGCCGLYDHYHDGRYGCWDDIDAYAELASELATYDGWLLHLSSTSLFEVLSCLDSEDYRVMSWVKPFAAFKKNVSVAYAWEPVIVKPCRKPEVSGRMVMRDWIDEPITLQRGLTGAKPERVCMWAFEVLGMHPDDELVDLFPGSGAVSRAWEKWRGQFVLSAAGIPAELHNEAFPILDELREGDG